MRALLLVVVLACAPATAWAGSNFSPVHTPGPYAVGLRVVEQYDYARAYRGTNDVVTGQPVSGERARPIQTLIWYPAHVAGAALTLADYYRLGASDDDFTRTPAQLSAVQAAFLQDAQSRLTPERAHDEFAAPMLAHLDASAVAGKFPVVIYAASFNSYAFENADLCEYLASLGYVVIASPSIGAHTRDMTNDVEGIEAQTGDIEFLIGYAHGLPQADSSKIAVVGYSWGGIANVFAAAKDSRINALVAFDGSVRYWADMIAQAKYVTPERVTAPLLYLAAHPVEIEQMTPGRDKTTSFLNRMRYADVYRVTLNPMKHLNFTSVLGQRLLPDEAYGDYDKDELSAAYGWAETYTGHFLDAYLKGDAAGLRFVQAARPPAMAPAHMLTLNSHLGAGAPPTREAFAAQLARNDFATAQADYQAFKARAPDFSLSEDDIDTWAYRLVAAGRLEDAASLLKLGTQLYPESSGLFDSLGEVYAKNGDKTKAIAAYHTSLKLDAGNVHAATQLKMLGARDGA